MPGDSSSCLLGSQLCHTTQCLFKPERQQLCGARPPLYGSPVPAQPEGCCWLSATTDCTVQRACPSLLLLFKHATKSEQGFQCYVSLKAVHPACWPLSNTDLQQQLACSLVQAAEHAPVCLLWVGGCASCTRRAAVCCLLCTLQCPSPYQRFSCALHCYCHELARAWLHSTLLPLLFAGVPYTSLLPALHPAAPLGWTGESLAARRNPFHRLVRPGADDAGAAGLPIQKGLFTADVALQHSALHLEVGSQPTQHSWSSMLCNKLPQEAAM